MREVLNRPNPYKQQKRRKAFRNFLWTILVLVALYFGVGFLSHIPKLNISEVESRGLKAISAEEISASALEYLSGNTALVYSRGNKFIYSKKEINDFLLAKFPRIYRINMIEREGQKLTLDIEERQAAYVWCGQQAPLYIERFTRKECFFLDQKGFVFDRSPYFTDGVYMAFYGGLEPETEPIGQTINLQNSIEDIRLLADKLDRTIIPIHSLVVKADGQHEFLIDSYSSTGDFSRIIWNEDVALDDTYQKISATVTEPQFEAEFAEKAATLLYIDTRFKNRVFYKFKDGI